MSNRRYGLLVEGKDITVPLKESKIDVTVQGFVANVQCQLVYTNDTTDAIQTSFVFPMDDMSAVYKFEAEVNKKHIIAECQDKQQAQKTYNEAISTGHTAMLLSEDDSAGDIFECKLGNLPAGETAELTMSYVVELGIEPEGKVRFTLPTVLNPRYSPDVGHLVEAGSKPTAGQVDVKTPCKLSFSASVSGQHKITCINSISDQLDVSINDNKQSASVRLMEEFKFDHDLSFDIVYENVNEPEIILELGNPDKGGLLKEDLLMLNFYPDIKQGQQSQNSKREFIFVIDRSGSMRGHRIQKAKETLLLLLKSLPVGCLFNVISFGSSHSSLFDKSQEYGKKTLQEAISLQKEIDANMGGTEILSPLQSIYSNSCKQGYPRQIFLLTDGEVGNTNDVISLVRNNKGNTRVFTFGIGDGVSTSLIKNVAKASNGKAVFIRDKDNMQAKVITAMKNSLDDCLSDVHLNWKIPSCFMVTDIPATPPAVFQGEKLVLFVLLKSSDKKENVCGSLELKGTLGGNSVSYKVNIESTGSSHSDLPLHRVAAKYQIKELEVDDSRYGRDGRDKIILVSQAANIISKYTAFVGVDKETKVPVSVIEELPVYNEVLKSCRLRSSMAARWCDSMDVQTKGYMMPATCGDSMGVRTINYMKKMFFSLMPKPSMPQFLQRRSHGDLECAADSRSMEEDSDQSDEMCHDIRSQDCEDTNTDDKQAYDIMMQIVSVQNFDGSWSSSPILARIMGISEKKLKAKYKSSIWCTAIVLVFLEENFAKRKTEWEMLFNKAVKWMDSQDRDGKTTNEILKEVRDSQVVKTT